MNSNRSAVEGAENCDTCISRCITETVTGFGACSNKVAKT